MELCVFVLCWIGGVFSPDLPLLLLPLPPLHLSLPLLLPSLPHHISLFLSVSPNIQTKLLTQYILNLGKYDQNYDIRDRTRFIRQLIVPNEKSGALGKYARRILLAPKPAPVLESTYKGTFGSSALNRE